MVMFERIQAFQQFINTNLPEDNLRKFIELSSMIFSCDSDDSFLFFDYMSVSFLFDYGVGHVPIVGIEPGMQLNNLWVSIPCAVDSFHTGVECGVINHLLGMGCFDCADEYGISGLFPIE